MHRLLAKFRSSIDPRDRNSEGAFRRPEWEQALLRVIIAGVAFTYAVTMVDPLERGLGSALTQALFVVPSVFLILSLALAFIVASMRIHEQPTTSPTRVLYRLATIIIDLGTLSTSMYFMPMEATPFYWVYLFVIIGNGMRYGLAYLYVATAVACGSFSFVVFSLPFWAENLHDGIGRAFGLLVIPAYSGVLIRRLQDRSDQLREAMHAKSRFIANMSHELRTPLHAVLALSETLLGRTKSREETSMLHMIKTSAMTQLELVNQILDVSKVEAGRYRIVSGPLNPYTVIEEVVEIIWPQGRDKGLDIRVYVDPRVPTALYGPGTELRQILVNLAGNAIKFTEHGAIDLRLTLLGHSSESSRVQFSVADTGVGIADADMQAIFEAFTQSDSTLTRRYGGTGLGLTISQQLVQLMGGHLNVSSRVGTGSVFRFEVNLGADPKGSLDSLPRIEPVHIVLAGFDEVPTALIDFCVEQGYRVDRAETLQQTVDMLESRAGYPDTKVVAINAAMARPFFVKVVQNIKTRYPDRRHAIIGLGANPLDAELQTAGATSLMPEFEALLFARALRLFAQPLAGDDERAPRRDLFGLRILVVDDNQTNREVARLVLKEAGHEVETAAGAEEGLELLLRKDYDLALLDLRMPVMSGLEVTQRYRAAESRRARMPIILLTADLASEVQQLAGSSGVDLVLTKPIQPQKLLAAIERVCVENHPPLSQPGQRLGPSAQESFDPLRLGSMPSLDPQRLQELEDFSLNGRQFVNQIAIAFIRQMDSELAALTDASAQPDLAERLGVVDGLADACAHLGTQRCFYLLHEAAIVLRENDTARYLELLKATTREWPTTRAELLQHLGLGELTTRG